MKNAKRILYLLLVFCLLLTGSLSASALNIGDVELEEQKAVLSASLSEVMASADESELIPVDIWVEEVNIDEVEAAALEETGLNKAKIAELDAQGVELTIEEVDKYIAAERRIYAERQKALSEQVMQNTLGSSEMGVPLVQRNVYVSKYTPVINVELSKAEIQTLAECNQVNTIYYAPNVEAVDEPIEAEYVSTASVDAISSLNEAVEKIRANRTRDELGYTGKGIRIGQIESEVPMVSISYLQGASITIKGSDPVRFHASEIAGILVSHDSKERGIVPDAHLFSTDYDDEKSFRVSVEWLLGTEANVHVINMSAYVGSITGAYDNICCWIDHLAMNHSVHFVKSAGNEGEESGYVNSPGMAANVITVGAANANCTGRADFSSYKEGNTIPLDKPDICAPGAVMYAEIYEGFVEGTSLSAPMVTAIVAQMIQARPALATYQDTVKAILTAAIHCETMRYTPGSTGYAECGAGLVDALSAVNVARYQDYTLNKTFPANASKAFIQAQKFTVSSSATLMRVSVAWLKNNRISGDHETNDPTDGANINIDMRITDPNGNEVGYKATIKSNVEIIEFIPSVAGEYTIWLQMVSNYNEKTYYGLAWW